jgi:hypothetical protein
MRRLCQPRQPRASAIAYAWPHRFKAWRSPSCFVQRANTARRAKNLPRHNCDSGLGLPRRSFAPVQINRSPSNQLCVGQFPKTSIATKMR